MILRRDVVKIQHRFVDTKKNFTDDPLKYITGEKGFEIVIDV